MTRASKYRSDFEPYANAYEYRILTLAENELEHQLGPVNYRRRRLFLQKFDDWREWGRRRYPWPFYFAEIKERRRRKIRTPEQFWRTLAACVRFVVEERRKNPNFDLPEQFLLVLVRVKPILDEIWPHIQERCGVIQAERHATSLKEAGV